VAVFTKNTFAMDSTQTYTVLSTTLGEMSVQINSLRLKISS